MVSASVRGAFRDAMADFPPHTCLTVAYSGGADSSALLYLTWEYCRERQISLRALHVHHGIRGEEADRDASFCRSVCEARGIAFLCRFVDAPACAEREKIGLEEAARRLRYSVFEEVTGAEGHFCLTAHSADDNLETVLFHMMRGTGLDGLCGIPPIRGRILRPLLGVSAGDIRAFCRENSIPYMEDSTNGDFSYTRNYIRGTVVPALRKITPHPERSVSRMTTHLRRDAVHLRREAEAILGENVQNTFVLMENLQTVSDAILFRICARLYTNAGGVRAPESIHLQAARDLIRQGRDGAVSFPDGFCLRVQSGMLQAEAQNAGVPEPPPEEFVLEEGIRVFAQYGFGVAMSRKNEENFSDIKNIYKLSICRSFPFATIQGQVHLRFRRPGDTIRQGKMTRSVKKLLNAAHMPPERRALLPFFADEGGLFWIPGIAARDGGDADGEQICLCYFIL